MSRSQETFFKKQREKERAKRKKEKREKKEAKKQQSDNSGLEIDWSSAPENVTLTPEEEKLRASNKTGE